MPIVGTITIALFKKAAVAVAVTAAAVPLPVPEDLPKYATPGCYDTYGGLHPCGSPECAEYASTCTCRNGEASRTEAVEPAGADEEVDEIGRPLRPSRRQPNLHVELPVVVVQPQSDVTLYKFAGDECGQVTFEKTKQL